MAAAHKVTVALDYANLADAKSLVSQLNQEHCNLKVGKELFTATGPAEVKRLVDMITHLVVGATQDPTDKRKQVFS